MVLNVVRPTTICPAWRLLGQMGCRL